MIVTTVILAISLFDQFEWQFAGQAFGFLSVGILFLYVGWTGVIFQPEPPDDDEDNNNL